MTDREHTLFVYGTLLRGEPGHPLLARARFLGDATTEPGFELVDLGDYPALVRGGSGIVAGELYAVDEATLARVDEYEEHPRFYRRTPIRLANGRAAESYLLHPDQVRHRPRIPHGSWRHATP